MKHYKIETKALPGSPEMAGIFLPLSGPWIIVSQHDAHQFENKSWANAQFMASRKGVISNSLELDLGQVALQENKLDSSVQIAAYHYDTSD